MPRLVVRCFAISLDGYSAAPGQSLGAPFGNGGIRLMDWAFATKHFSAMFGKPGAGSEGIDNDFAVHADDNIGATIMGRHMFGPDRGPWDPNWKGWWGEEPPYHHPVFVLCHQKREPLELKGTTFTFVTDGIESALKQAFAAAKGKDVRIGGGADTVRQYLKAGLIDELHLVQVPLLLGQGERIFEGLGGVEDRYDCKEFTPSKAVSHLRVVKKA